MDCAVEEWGGGELRPLVHLIWPRLAGQFTFQISDFIASRIAGITFHFPFAIFHFHFHYGHSPTPAFCPCSTQTLWLSEIVAGFGFLTVEPHCALAMLIN